ncbi:DinB family protein [Poriferisphaera sp. WC338]|uniref:DinB family protein n=1 Tax=Poriferisphaera sp. WC338 TaxID=3425129 RepID=UPI003D819241
MINIQTVFDEMNLHEQIALQFLEPIPEDRMTEQPNGLRNHPTWILGHLTAAHNAAISILTDISIRPESETALFAIGSTPHADPALYPDKQTLIDNYLDIHQHYIAAVTAASPEKLAAPSPLERHKGRFSSLAMFVLHVGTAHEAYHLGQLSAWRQATGIAPPLNTDTGNYPKN